MTWLAPEFAPQAAMLLIWPRDRADWGASLKQARDAIAAIAAALAADQRVVLVAHDDECLASIRGHARLKDIAPDALHIVPAANDDIWARDSGPISTLATRSGGERTFNDFRFDGWGGKFDARNDDALTRTLYERGALGDGRVLHHDWVLEGGSVETNGAGALLTTERCLLSSGRNAGLDRAAIEARLQDALGVGYIHWLHAGELIGDDTDSHIDTLARFADAETIVYQGCADPYDAHYRPLKAMAAELATLMQADGRPYRLAELPLPAPIHDPNDGHRLPAGYANFLIGNSCVLAPVFDDPADAPANAILARLFPGRRIVPIDSRTLIRQNGGLHCAAMQIPAP